MIGSARRRAPDRSRGRLLDGCHDELEKLARGIVSVAGADRPSVKAHADVRCGRMAYEAEFACDEAAPALELVEQPQRAQHGSRSRDRASHAQPAAPAESGQVAGLEPNRVV